MYSSSSGSINKFLKVFEHCQASVSLLPIPGFSILSGFTFFSSILLATHDLVW